MNMRGLLIPAVAAGFAALILAGAQPAAALPGPGALAQQTGPNSGLVQDVSKRWRRYGYRPYAYRPYAYRPYAYRPYAYRPYAYRPYAYRPYGYYGYGYPYWRRPGVSLWFGF